jgi:acetamidase/formamidase
MPARSRRARPPASHYGSNFVTPFDTPPRELGGSQAPAEDPPPPRRAGPLRLGRRQRAGPGDTLAVEILDIHTQGWGWTAILPGLGLLPDDFPDAYLRIFDLSHGDVAYMRADIAIPLTPFFGTMGVCPAGASGVPVMPPGNSGGNLDTRQLVAGATLYLPVQVENALFSCGDAHGCQGDGEVCVTGLEAPMFAALRFTLEKGGSIPSPQYRTPRRSPRASTTRRSTAPPASGPTCSCARRRRSGRWSSTSRPPTTSAARTPTC